MNSNTYQIIYYTINVCVALPFALQIFAYIICIGYRKAACDIHNTKKEIFRSIKLRYTNSAKLGIPLKDARSYVTKYLYGQGGPFKFPAILEKMSSFIYCLALMTTIAMFLRHITDFNRMIAILAASFCFFIFRTAFSVHRQMELTVEFAVDYLENTLKHRLAPEKVRAINTTNYASKENINAPEIPSSSNVTPEKPSSDVIPISQKKKDVIIDIPKENSDIIEAVLQEFLA